MVKYNTDNLNDVFSVLSDPTRRSIIEQLSKGERSVQELAQPFDMSLPAISKHLKVLENAGLVTHRKEGRYRYYSIKPDSMDDACEWMETLKQLWSKFGGMFGCSKNTKQ
ncbi:ArsR/SmtB family transcription factor [Fictibacillus barbaricus]|uniref:Winged helix-turn-helix transcriptional regulator n=1 Tax=Fictibacillus barbaricus TaxID=182136 RepID=A0ABS2ZAF9_9BACL|nr:metalloregulator ArsR/SmtB family transcription factor [Fictibacillus barbaricus]MBN3544318.1 winged helix-turn-helix transcriptional regulator [Fictibacillus barbaricus]GGB67815.1 transcriptional regulator [Fictibacillus barbaricus]